MTATAHAIIGGAIAASTGNSPALGISLSAISHPIVDLIPHWDFGCGWRKKSKTLLFLQSSADFIFGIIVTFLIFGNIVDPLYLFACILISESWDILQMPYLLFGWKFPFELFYKFGHLSNGKTNMTVGILTQLGTVTGLMLALRFIG